jgi:hypothetical protein
MPYFWNNFEPTVIVVHTRDYSRCKLSKIHPWPMLWLIKYFCRKFCENIGVFPHNTVFWENAIFRRNLANIAKIAIITSIPGRHLRKTNEKIFSEICFRHFYLFLIWLNTLAFPAVVVLVFEFVVAVSCRSTEIYIVAQKCSCQFCCVRKHCNLKITFLFWILLLPFFKLNARTP